MTTQYTHMYNGLTLEECERAYGCVMHNGKQITIVLVAERDSSFDAKSVGADDDGNMYIITIPNRPIVYPNLLGDMDDYTVVAV